MLGSCGPFVLLLRVFRLRILAVYVTTVGDFGYGFAYASVWTDRSCVLDWAFVDIHLLVEAVESRNPDLPFLRHFVGVPVTVMLTLKAVMFHTLELTLNSKIMGNN